MSRHRKQKSYGHQVRLISPDCYRISWVLDRYTKNGRIRLPTSYSTITDGDGAFRFSKKWDVPMPGVKK